MPKHMRRKRFIRRKGVKRTARRMAAHGRFKQPTTMYAKELICADRAVVKLRYLNVDNFEIPDSALNAFSVVNYNLNGLFDVSPSLGSKVVPGFEEWGLFYNSYRAIGCHVKVTVVNGSNFPQYCQISALNPDNFSGSWDIIRSRRANQYTKTKLMQGTGNNGTIQSMSMYVPFSDLVGSSYLYRGNLNYEGHTTGGVLPGANPVILFPLEIAVLAFTPTVGASVVACKYNMELTWDVEFYNRIDQTEAGLV